MAEFINFAIAASNFNIKSSVLYAVILGKAEVFSITFWKIEYVFANEYYALED